MIYVLIAVALVLAFLGYLVWPGAGLGVHQNLPVSDRQIDFRVRFGSLAAKMLRKSKSANHHFVLFGVIHVADFDLTAAQFCHELYHVLREKQLGIAHVWRYLTSGKFRTVEETEAEEFQKGWRTNAELLHLLGTLNNYGAQKRG